MTKTKFEKLVNIAKAAGLAGHITCRINSFGDRVEFAQDGKYYGVYDLVKQTWVD